MSIELTDEILKYLKDCEQETLDLIEVICGIPAPSWHEEKRAEFCKKWLEENGAKGVYIDSALNVIYPIGCKGKDDIVVFAAHTDTVFSDLEPMPFLKDDEYFYCPGVSDDTASVAVLLMVARYIAQNKLEASCGILIVANSGEEGLGNLKGTRQLMKDYEGRIKEFYTFDANLSDYANKVVGSHRYELIFETEGGHSYGAFGNRSAVYAMADLICKLHKCEIPVEEGSKTTYNVGVVEGGTSVNTIPQSAKMLYEYRSNSEKCLSIMKDFFEKTVEEARKSGLADIRVTLVGDRPCSSEIDEKHFAEMEERVVRITEKHTGQKCVPYSSSTDCNIPMSMGIPGLAVANCTGIGAHTREEKLVLASVPIGLKITAELILSYFN